MITLKGRQVLLRHQFSVLTYQRDIITILDNLNSIKNEVHSIDKKVDSNLIMTGTKTLYQKSSKSTKHAKPNQDINEEQKMSKDGSYSYSNNPYENQYKDEGSYQACDGHSKKRYKDKVDSINMIVRKETESLNKQKQDYVMKLLHASLHNLASACSNFLFLYERSC